MSRKRGDEWRSEALARQIGAALGVVGGFALGYGMVHLGALHAPGSTVVIALTSLEGLIFCYLGAPYVTGGWRRVNFRLSATPLPDLLAGVAGMTVGLVVAALIGYFVRDFPYGVGLSAILALLLGLMGAQVGLTRRVELGALMGGGEGLGSGPQAVLIDTSAIIDGRVLDVSRTGFLDLSLVVPRSVLHELQLVADSADDSRRARGRRGLDVLTLLEKEPGARIEILDDDDLGALETDSRLVRLARQRSWAILTTDFNLNRVAQLEGVKVLNLNDLANALRPIALPGEQVRVLVAKPGNQKDQGVAYLDDGTMVVIEGGVRFMNQTIEATVTSVVQTSAGRMVFASPEPGARRGRRPPAASSS